MINSIFNFCQNVNFEINLFELIKSLLSLVLISMIIIVGKKIVYRIKNEREIDQRLREKRARIAQVVTEIEDFKDSISEPEEKTTKLSQTLESTEFVRGNLTTQVKIEHTKQIIENAEPDIKDGEDPIIQDGRDETPKRKKTRAMPMEERWADFDKKRAIRNTA